MITGMDLISLTVVVNIAFIMLVISYLVYMSRNDKVFQTMGIAGPEPWLGLGNLPDIVREGMFNFHRRLYNKYSDEKVYGYFDPGQPVFVVRDVDMIRDLCVKKFNCFVNHRVLTREAPFGHILPYLKDDQWRRVRNAVSPAFTSGRLKRMSGHVRRNVQDLLSVLQDACRDQTEIELKDTISCYTMDVIASTGFGVNTNSLQKRKNSFLTECRHLIQVGIRAAVLTILFPFLMPILNKLGVGVLPSRSLKFFAKFVDQALERPPREMASNSSSLIQMLAETKETRSKSPSAKETPSSEDKKALLSYMEIQGQALAFILAGFDSVSTALSFTLFLLACHPECCAAAQEEIDRILGAQLPDYTNVQNLSYLDMCLNESLRMYPPGVFQDRVCNEDCVIQGFKIKKDSLIVIPVVGVHYDPVFWPEPEKFDPDRFTMENKSKRHPYAFMPFGHGPRNCIGQRLALLMIKICLASILQQMTPMRCSKSVFPVTVANFLMGAKDGLWVRMTRRTNRGTDIGDGC